METINGNSDRLTVAARAVTYWERIAMREPSDSPRIASIRTRLAQACKRYNSIFDQEFGK